MKLEEMIDINVKDVGKIKIHKESVILHKFVLADIKSMNYFRVGGYYGTDEHSKIMHSIMKELKQPFDLRSNSTAGESYRILSAGIATVRPRDKWLYVYGESFQYKIGITKEGVGVLKKLFPGWDIRYRFS